MMKSLLIKPKIVVFICCKQTQPRPPLNIDILITDCQVNQSREFLIV